MDTLKKIIIWVCIMIAVMIGGDVCIRQILKTTQFSKPTEIREYINNETSNIDKESLLVGFLVFLCLY